TLAVAGVWPLVVWLLLAWPTGRLSRGMATFVIAYGAIVVLFPQAEFVADQWLPTDHGYAFVLLLLSRLDVIVNVFVELGGLLVALVLLVRRQQRLPPKAQGLVRPVVAAAVLTVAAWSVSGLGYRLIPDTRSITQADALFESAYFVGFFGVAVLFAVAAWRRSSESSQSATVDLGEARMSRPVASVVVETLDDPSARVLFPTAEGWVDATGVSVEATRAGRTLTVIDRDDVVVAAIEHADAVEPRPAALEAAAGSLALLVEHDALDAQTKSRLRELAELRVAMLDAEDSARRLLERDLHDGTQQQ